MPHCVPGVLLEAGGSVRGGAPARPLSFGRPCSFDRPRLALVVRTRDAAAFHRSVLLRAAPARSRRVSRCASAGREPRASPGCAADTHRRRRRRDAPPSARAAVARAQVTESVGVAGRITTGARHSGPRSPRSTDCRRARGRAAARSAGLSSAALSQVSLVRVGQLLQPGVVGEAAVVHLRCRVRTDLDAAAAGAGGARNAREGLGQRPPLHRAAPGRRGVVDEPSRQRLLPVALQVPGPRALHQLVAQLRVRGRRSPRPAAASSSTRSGRRTAARSAAGRGDGAVGARRRPRTPASCGARDTPAARAARSRPRRARV